MIRETLSRLRFLVTRKPADDTDEEIRLHLEELTETYIQLGLTPQEARRKARIVFGGIERTREESYRQRPGWWIDVVLQDVRYALRQLARTPAFTTTAVLTLALGIGANAAIFTLVNAVLLKNLPVTDPKTLVRIGDQPDCCVGNGHSDDGEFSYFSTNTYTELKKSLPEFEDLAAMQAGFGFRPIIARRDRNGETARSVMGEFVSGNYFRTFGLTPEAGRLITDSDDVIGAPLSAVMSYDTWKNQYNSDPAVVGSTFWINTKAVTVVGVAPEGFYGDRLSPEPPEFYLPIESMPPLANAPYVHDRTQWLYIVGRLKPGVALGPLQEKINAHLRQVFLDQGSLSAAKDKDFLPRVHATLSPGGAGIQSMQEGYASNLHLLMGVSGLVLLIACANIANLLLVRGMARKAEMSVRTALGAMRGRIVQQLLTESLVLSLLSGLAGLIVAYLGTRALLLLAFPGAQNVPIHATPSLPVMGFAIGLSLLTGVLFGVAPAWIAAQAQPVDALRSTTRTTAAGASLLQRGLVILQAALSLVLLVVAGLFSQSLGRLQGTDLKIQTKNRYIIHINPQAAGYSQTQLEALFHTMEDRFHAIPGVLNVGISSYTPMEDNNNGWGFQVEGIPNQSTAASIIRTNAEYFNAVGTRLIEGRGFTPQDTSTAPAVGIVNESFARRFFKPGESPIGHRFGAGAPNDFQIVGVVEDSVYTSVRWKNHRMVFIPLMRRSPSDTSPIEKDDTLYAGAIVLQTSRPMSDLESISRHTLAGINPNLTVVKFQTFNDQIADRFTNERLLARLTSLFGILALLLATIGLYGVTAYHVARRTSEIGIRMALGAERLSVVAMVMRGAILQTVVGLAIGIPVALLCVRYVKAQLYEITAINPYVMTIAIATLAAAACIAGLIPARRAASTDPAQALRAE
ncbi:duplicated orphan permease [Granulicella pectinivorans]|uniref:Duplicated orphan permease n=1 Tax=Granulicella pectinivorans TaxID=474950 RepID=A0A1I6LJV5_9BACT|nr:ABC transporter permease [Granulicella pectinivorans]SFS03681.1 duplicated orphan permease [Granulicella pectinivorans]